MADPSPQSRTREGLLAAILHRMPPEKLLMPTAFGNVLRAGELRPARRYGLDPVIVWPRLWLLLPETARQEIVGSRNRVDAAGRALMWALATIVWSGLVWWIGPVALVLAVVMYRGSLLPAAYVFSDLVEAAFELHRPLLYEALRLPLPEGATDEPESGQIITRGLWEGYLPESTRYLPRHDESP